MAGENAARIQRLYEAINRARGDGRPPDRATAEALGELFDPEVEVQQMADIAGTAGAFPVASRG